MQKCMKSLLALLFLLCTAVAAFAQNVTITGIVIDTDNEPLPGVNVQVRGTSMGTATDVDGKYSIQVPGSQSVLVFSYVGFLPQDFQVGNQRTINVTLREDTQNLDEVVVVAYGTQKVRSITGSMSKLSTDEISDMPVSNMSQKLQGKFSGVQILQNNGQPNGGLSIRIRGQASINAGNSPLVVVDGFASRTGLEVLSPDEIESITVLKDAASTALYGSRASNGVIMVTTRQAKEGRTNIEFSTNIGVSIVGKNRRPDVMNAQEFAQFKKEYHEDQMRYEGKTDPVPDMYANPAGIKDGTDWFDLLLQPAKRQSYNLSLSTGVGRLRSSANLNYYKEEGVILNTWSDRATVRLNNYYQATDKIAFGVNLSGAFRYSQITGSLGEGRNIIGSAILMDPQLIYKYGPNETPWDGTYPGMSKNINDYKITKDGIYPLGWEPPGMFANPNWYNVLMERKNPNRRTNLLTNAYMDITIITGLKYKLSANANLTNGESRSWTPSTATGGMFSKPPGNASGSYALSNGFNWTIENLLTYTKKIGAHSFDLMAGQSAMKDESRSASISASNFADDEVDWWGAGSTRTGNAGTSTEYSLLSYFGRVNYDFNGKYLLQLSLRSDGCSRFGANKKFATFPAVSAGWIVSDEAFMKSIAKLSYLKIRGSYGSVGNYDIGNYTYLASVTSSDYIFNGTQVGGKSLNRLDNNDLTWETTVTYDIGADIGIYKDRIFLVYDYYWKKTDGLLYQIELPRQSGFANVQSNIGQFNFWGHEFNLETRNFVGAFKWKTQMNIYWNRNEVKKLGTEDVHIGGNSNQEDWNRTAVGHPMGQFFGYIYDGVFMTQAEYEAGPKHASSMVGTVRMKDLNGDGIIDMDDRTFIGDPTPKFLYGITNEFSYKNFDASLVMAGSVGGKIIDATLEWTENIDGVFNVTKECAERWRSEENPGKGKIPRTRSGTTELFRYNNTRWVFDGTYLMVKNLTFGYTFPLKSNSYVKGIRLFLSGQNLATLTKYPGMNPEVGASGSNGLQQGRDWTSYPVPKVYTMGVNVKF